MPYFSYFSSGSRTCPPRRLGMTSVNNITDMNVEPLENSEQLNPELFFSQILGITVHLCS